MLTPYTAQVILSVEPMLTGYIAQAYIYFGSYAYSMYSLGMYPGTFGAMLTPYIQFSLGAYMLT